jgi:hypothetical protein
MGAIEGSKKMDTSRRVPGSQQCMITYPRVQGSISDSMWVILGKADGDSQLIVRLIVQWFNIYWRFLIFGISP